MLQIDMDLLGEIAVFKTMLNVCLVSFGHLLIFNMLHCPTCSQHVGSSNVYRLAGPLINVFAGKRNFSLNKDKKRKKTLLWKVWIDANV